MNLISIENLTKSVCDTLLFSNLSFGLEQGQKAAFIARNGTGKTTLLNIIAGLDTADEGKVIFRQSSKLAYLQQEVRLEPQQTIIEWLLDFNLELAELINHYESLVASAEPDRAEIERIIGEMEEARAWDYESRLKEIAGKLGFQNLQRRTGELSGGETKKLALVKVLLAEADLLLLDEPTNQLDIKMIEWLEDYLSRQKLSLLLVSHDRYFIDRVCNEIIELDRCKLFHYKGNYTYYLEKKSEKDEAETIEIEKVRNRYKTELEWMKRMPKARGTKQKARIQAFFDLEEKINRPASSPQANFMASPQRIGKKILELHHIHKSFDGKAIMTDFSYTFKKSEKIGIIGPNGAGKTTLLNIIMGKIKPEKGHISKGETIKFGYFTQERLELDSDQRIIEIVKNQAAEIPTPMGNLSASQFLQYFGFSYSSQYTYYSSLSGGEKRKLQLLLTLIKNPNFLILDEPTNDMDIFTLNQLEIFLENYTGCVLAVSHDRFFIDRIADHVFAFEGNGRIIDFPGNYSQYIATRKTELTNKNQPRTSKQPEVQKIRKGLSWKEKNELQNLEIEIESLEMQKDELLETMALHSQHHEKLFEISKKYKEIETLIEEKITRWIFLSEKNEDFNS
ncbi:MAG TPA: ABC-F family ATP-binding cassette domain-containing protein [Bacteroidales bacterium]|jgi:ATP-binding cassette subfamily F protein uup|nr:ABC-F family ATP-binding cassette domain-containing protein [Bacteroidales bacterium]MDI9574047.1 ABC-F family ATP-binding cassette domain-containing protein [Bacteroidota bacterium]MBP9512502.1 ABC-F family ATP-binding cassette domain-containing protein [Bacteroidales bacterium]MBP9588991.1 ABC-F family ATP-binding cassette domain-containing protein [Bacteroidales bacterium]NMD16595.1 ABC-F family ATP-binding cassette domain-containing protein [Bacteroidales bacterium]